MIEGNLLLWCYRELELSFGGLQVKPSCLLIMDVIAKGMIPTHSGKVSFTFLGHIFILFCFLILLLSNLVQTISNVELNLALFFTVRK